MHTPHTHTSFRMVFPQFGSIFSGFFLHLFVAVSISIVRVVIVSMLNVASVVVELPLDSRQ